MEANCIRPKKSIPAAACPLEVAQRPMLSGITLRTFTLSAECQGGIESQDIQSMTQCSVSDGGSLLEHSQLEFWHLTKRI